MNPNGIASGTLRGMCSMIFQNLPLELPRPFLQFISIPRYLLQPGIRFLELLKSTISTRIHWFYCYFIWINSNTSSPSTSTLGFGRRSDEKLVSPVGTVSRTQPHTHEHSFEARMSLIVARWRQFESLFFSPGLRANQMKSVFGFRCDNILPTSVIIVCFYWQLNLW